MSAYQVNGRGRYTLAQALARAARIERESGAIVEVRATPSASASRYQAAVTGTDPRAAARLNAALRAAWGLA